MFKEQKLWCRITARALTAIALIFLLIFAWEMYIEDIFSFGHVTDEKHAIIETTLIAGFVILFSWFGYRSGLIRQNWRKSSVEKEKELIENYKILEGAHLLIEEQAQSYKQLAEEANEDKNIALAANRTKSEFLANMSHELRTPLNAIIGFSQMMASGMGGELSDKHKEYSNDILSSGNHLLKIINDILDLSKVEAGKTEIYPENVSISSIFKDCIGIISERAQEKTIRIEVKTSCDGLFVYADPVRVKQIVLNLLSNSVKFTSENGKINVSCMVNDKCFVNDKIGNKIVITIEDNGIGMDEDGVKAALTKFGQANTGLAREYEGTGLGLPLSIELAKLMNGTVDVTSELGVGTTITVTLPKGESSDCGCSK